jgi:hypothetical protein
LRRICRNANQRSNNAPSQPKKPVELPQHQRKIAESRQIAEYFNVLNQTNWCKFDDKFYLISRRWFDKWKQFVSYDYIVRALVEEGKRESDLSYNRLLNQDPYPGEIFNQPLLLERTQLVRNHR